MNTGRFAESFVNDTALNSLESLESVVKRGFEIARGELAGRNILGRDA